MPLVFGCSDIANDMISGLPPKDGWPVYTSPTVCMPNGTYIMDSTKIVEELEKMCPEPALHLDNELHDGASMGVVGPLLGDFMVAVRDLWLDERSREWFVNNRQDHFKMTIAEIAKERGGEKGWEAAQNRAGEPQGSARQQCGASPARVFGTACAGEGY